ncbi:hypothetical protein OAJ50_04010 [Candidatus Nitrosopelagicus sp.]|nr:hypothetical protein [Candidatus Nitrosopelagicus sp.]
MGLMDKFKGDNKKSDKEELRPNMNEVTKGDVDIVPIKTDTEIEDMEKQIAEMKESKLIEEQKRAEKQAEVERIAKLNAEAQKQADAIEEKQKATEHQAEQIRESNDTSSSAFIQELQAEFQKVVLQIRPLEEHAIKIEDLLAEYGQKPIMPKD